MENTIVAFLQLPVEKKAWSKVYSTLWCTAHRGEKDIIIWINNDIDIDIYKKELVELGFSDIKKKLRIQKGAGIKYDLTTTFTEDCNPELYQIYQQSVCRFDEIKKLSQLEQQCRKLLNTFYIDLQLATNNDESVVFIKNPGDGTLEGAYDEKAFEIIRTELDNIPNICYKIVRAQCYMWNEDMIAVWNWPIDGKINDRFELSEQDAPGWLCLEFETSKVLKPMNQ